MCVAQRSVVSFSPSNVAVLYFCLYWLLFCALRKLSKCVCTISVSGICFYLEFEKYCLIVYFSYRWAGCLWKIALATENIFICYRLITIFICVKHSYIWMEAKESLTRVMVLLPCSKDSWKSILNARCLLETASAQVSCLLILFSVFFFSSFFVY